MKSVQYFTDEYLEQCSKATPLQILEYLEQFRLMQSHLIRADAKPVKSKLISIKIPEDLLKAFRAKCEIENVKYQTHIKSLMKSWLDGSD